MVRIDQSLLIRNPSKLIKHQLEGGSEGSFAKVYHTEDPDYIVKTDGKRREDEDFDAWLIWATYLMLTKKRDICLPRIEMLVVDAETLSYRVLMERLVHQKGKVGVIIGETGCSLDYWGHERQYRTPTQRSLDVMWECHNEIGAFFGDMHFADDDLHCDNVLERPKTGALVFNDPYAWPKIPDHTMLNMIKCAQKDNPTRVHLV